MRQPDGVDTISITTAIECIRRFLQLQWSFDLMDSYSNSLLEERNNEEHLKTAALDKDSQPLKEVLSRPKASAAVPVLL